MLCAAGLPSFRFRATCWESLCRHSEYLRKSDVDHHDDPNILVEESHQLGKDKDYITWQHWNEFRLFLEMPLLVTRVYRARQEGSRNERSLGVKINAINLRL